MTIKLTLLLASAVITLAAVGTANAADLKSIGQIAVLGEPLTSFDIGFVDQKTHRYLLADRSNKSVDILDSNADAYVVASAASSARTAPTINQC